RRRRRRGDQAALPRAGQALPAGAPPRKVRRHPRRLREPPRSDHARTPSALRGGQQRLARRDPPGAGMSEVAPPDVPADAAVAGPRAGTAALADFRRWCEEALAGGELPAPAPPGPDLATLLGHFVALRQEVNLQTRSVRAQQEQTVEFARGVQQAIEN